MRPSLRTSLSLIIFILVIVAVIWMGSRPASRLSPARPPVAQVDSSLVKEAVTPAVDVNMEVLHDFQTWIDQFRSGVRGEAFMEQGRLFAEQRRISMLHLIQQNSSAALGASLSYAEYADLPDELQALVEEPFTLTGDVLVTAICDHDYHTPEHRVNVYLEDQTRLRIGHEFEARTGLSKLDVPIQGIELDGWAALHSTVFEIMEGADADWAWKNLPSGNPDPGLDFFTGEPLGFNPVTAVAGGFSFLFSSEETLNELEAFLRELDNLPGRYTGSSIIFTVEVQTQAKGFPIQLIQESQNQLSIDNTTGAKTTLFIRAVFSDKPDAPISKADLESQINTSVSSHLSNFSYGKTSMTATVSDNTYQVSMVSTEYAFTGGGDTVDEKDLWDEAVALWRADGEKPDPYGIYDIVGVVFPKIDGVGWAGLGTVGGANSQHWLNGVASTETILHEFGHNYGLGHSNYWVFDSSNAASMDPVDASGANEEYGDYWDVMGDGDSNRGHFHMAAKRYISWLDANQVTRIDEAGESGTYRVFRFDHKDATGLQGLEIRKAGNENYWVGFRRAFESNANYYQGGYILWERPPSGSDRNQGWIIDTTPGSVAERQDAGISLGRTYSDATAEVHITPIAVGGSSPDEYLDVVVNYGTFAGNNAPTVTLNAPSTGDARNPVALSATGNDADGDTLVYSWDLGNGEVYSSTDSISATYTVGGAFDVSVTVTDMKGGTMTQSAQIVIDDPVNTWTTRTSGTAGDLIALARNGSHVVAAGHGVFLRSSDGSSWTSHTPGGVLNVTINDIAWTGSEFIAVGQDFDFDINSWVVVIFTSPDGDTWTKDFSTAVVPGGSSLQSTGLNGVASNPDGSQVVAVGDAGMIYKRIDGGDWTLVDLGIDTNTLLGGIVYGGGVFVLGGYQFGAGGGLALFNTLDTVNWANLKDNSDLMPWWGLDEIAFFNDFFIGSGFFSRTVFSENSGVSWQSLQQGNTHEMNAFAFGNGVYYAIGEDKDNSDALVNLVSNNGKIWTEVDSGVAENGNEVIFFNNSFLIVGDGGSIRQSGLVGAGTEVLAAPVFSPLGQEFSDLINVTITTDVESAEIRYTLDGSEPTVGSTLYVAAINITETTTVKAKVFKAGLDPSPTATATYTKGVEVLAAPVISPSSLEFSDSINITITTTAENAETRYTLDDSEPTSGSTAYSGEITITETTTVKAKVFKDGIDPSPTATETYTKAVPTGYDLWINTFSQGADAVGSANPDGDWASNLFEWFVGSSPDDVSDVPDAPEFSFSQSQQAVFTIHRFSKSSDVFLVVEKSFDLENWQVMTTTIATDTDTMLELVTDDPILFVPCFLRIKAEDVQ